MTFFPVALESHIVDKCLLFELLYIKTSKIQTSIFRNTLLFKINWDTLNSESRDYF